MFGIEEYDQCLNTMQTVINVVNKTVCVYGEVMTEDEFELVTKVNRFLIDVANGILTNHPDLYTADKPALGYLNDMAEILEDTFKDVLNRINEY